MPIGELSVLASAMLFSMTGIVQKTLVSRFRPLTLGALGSGGGALAGLILVLTISDIGELTRIPTLYLVLGILGGIINIGLGEPLYLLFLRNVDISKAWPMVAGLLSSYSLLSGIFVLGEAPSRYDIAGVVVIAMGVYLLSFGQRRYTDKNQASWLGFKGVLLLALVASFWVSGLTIQGFALRHMDPPLLNMTRLSAVCIFLTVMSGLGVNDILLPSEEDAALGFGRRVKKALSQGLVARTVRRVLRLEGSIAHQDSDRRRRRFRSGWSYRMSGVAVTNGSISLGVASMLFLVGVQRAGLSIAAALSSTQIFWTTTLSAIVLRERVNPTGIAGVLTLFGGILLILLL